MSSILAPISKNLFFDKMGGASNYNNILSSYCNDSNVVASNDHLAMYLSNQLSIPILNLSTDAKQSFLNWKKGNRVKAPIYTFKEPTCIFSDKLLNKKIGEFTVTNKVLMVYHENNQRNYEYWLYLVNK